LFRIATSVGVLAVFLLVLARESTAQTPAGPQQAVEVIGERDPSGQHYTITVRNHRAAAIRQIELPHFRVDLWSGPSGWETSGTNIQGREGTRSENGVLKAVAEGPSHEIAAGGSARFEMRVNRIGAPRGLGTARLSLADGSVISVEGVELPTAPSWFSNYATMILLAVILVAFIAYQVIRSNRARATPPAP